MTDKRLNFRYGQSGATDKAAEEELRRRGFSESHIRGVTYGYRQGEYSRGKKPDELPVRETEAAAPRAATDKVPMMYHGPFKGQPLTEVPDWYLAFAYGSFSKAKDRRNIEAELRSRGCDDEELEYFKKKYPCKGKAARRQGGADAVAKSVGAVPGIRPYTKKKKPKKKAMPKPKVPSARLPEPRKKNEENAVIEAAVEYMGSGARTGGRPVDSLGRSPRRSTSRRSEIAPAANQSRQKLPARTPVVTSLKGYVQKRRGPSGSGGS